MKTPTKVFQNLEKVLKSGTFNEFLAPAFQCSFPN
jgi:hypothetical protein